MEDVLERRGLRLRDDVVPVESDGAHASQEPGGATGDEDVAGSGRRQLGKPRARSDEVGVVELEVHAGLGVEDAHVRLDERRDVVGGGLVGGRLCRARAETGRRDEHDPRQARAHALVTAICVPPYYTSKAVVITALRACVGAPEGAREPRLRALDDPRRRRRSPVAHSSTAFFRFAPRPFRSFTTPS